MQEIVLDVTPEAQQAMGDKKTLVINGTLDYPACDDKVCYSPVSVPLSWTIALRPFVR